MSIKNDHDDIMIMCPPYPEYEEAPKEQSKSELRDCPKCNNKMWLSKKKKGIILFSALIDKDIILACYHCITKMAKESPEMFIKSKRVEI